MLVRETLTGEVGSIGSGVYIGCIHLPKVMSANSTSEFRREPAA